VAVAERAPELVEAELLVLAELVEALVAFVDAVKMTNWDPPGAAAG
jgi:hypothetical protein